MFSENNAHRQPVEPISEQNSMRKFYQWPMRGSNLGDHTSYMPKVYLLSMLPTDFWMRTRFRGPVILSVWIVPPQ